MSNIYDSARRVFIDLPRGGKQALAMSLDALLLLIAFQMALWLRFEFFFFDQHYLFLSLIACAGGLVTLKALGLYRHILRYMTERVVLAVVGGIAVSIMLVTAADTFLQLGRGLSRAVLVVYGLLAIGSLIGSRMLVRRILFPNSPYITTSARVPVIIYGAGNAGSQLATALQNGPHYKLAGFIDDDKSKHKLLISGLRIYPPSHLPDLIEEHELRQLLIAMPGVSRRRLREIIDEITPYQLRIRLVPSLRELVDHSDRTRLRDLQIEDLLGRDPVAPQPGLMGRCVTNRNVMVTGAGGSIGSELCRQIMLLAPRRLVLFEMSELALYLIEQELSNLKLVGFKPELVAILGSVRDESACLRAMQQHEVETVYHAAAYKHVPIVEHNVFEGILTNAFGTLAMSQACIEAGVKDCVLISTDKAVRPTNVMGASKRLAELVLQAQSARQTGTHFAMVRFGNVLGSSGSVVPLFQKQILSGGPVTLTHKDITRYFMTIPEAAQLVLQAGAMGESGSVFLLDMGEPVRIIDLAERMIKLYGLTVRDERHPDGDIEIRAVGLRPGEKLYEELLIDGNVLTTPHPRIMRAQEKFLPYDVLMESLQAMRDDIEKHDKQAVLAHLRHLVQEYVPATHS